MKETTSCGLFLFVLIQHFLFDIIVTKVMIDSEIRDRRKIKWSPASFMPKGFVMTREIFKNQAPSQKE